ncbi:MAG: nitrile hydratase subunit beta [Turicibacter sp.]|nr:nitrile hydratase subunit beta [Turicibacter sp.]
MAKDIRNVLGMASNFQGATSSVLDFLEASEKLEKNIQELGGKQVCFIIYSKSHWHGQGEIPLEALEPVYHLEFPSKLYPSEGAHPTTLQQALELFLVRAGIQ